MRMTKEITVLKRDGSKELLDLEKMHNVVFYACEGITGVSPSEVEIKSHIQFYNGITSDEIQETLIKAAADLINGDTPNYQWVAGRLINYHLRKEVYGQFEPFHLTDVARKNVDLGYYDPQFFEKYTAEEIEKLNSLIKHDRDENIAYVGMEQFRGKYLVQNRVTGAIYETPQIAYMMMSATLFQDYPKNTRMKYIKEMYDAVSNFDLSLPTPIMAGVRTPQRQFSSCVLIETDDSLDSINATSSSIVKYVSQKAGIGIGAGSIRAIGSPIRQGDASHTGVIPFYKMFQSAVKSCSQGGVRGGAATLHYPIWHLEVEDLLVLKNNKGTEDNRVRHLDYSVQFNKLMYERLLTGGNITLFSPADVPGLYDAFFNDQDEFRRLYETAERNTKLRKQVIPASDLFSTFMEERKNTGRVYLQNVDHANTHSSFDEKLAPIHMSNLCQEITLPTKPLNDLNDPNGEISLCTLAAVNWGNIKTVAEFERVCRLAVRALDELLDYQKYPVLAAELSTM
ncbi:ribonucleoside-diphosphate reductase subunit alpha, partial [bacterium]|nr:ribonucleoside-diphosphate reductase subunit alpha [bacterium]